MPDDRNMDRKLQCTVVSAVTAWLLFVIWVPYMDGIRLIDGDFWLSHNAGNKRPGPSRSAPEFRHHLEISGELSSLMREVKREGSVVISEPAPVTPMNPHMAHS